MRKNERISDNNRGSSPQVCFFCTFSFFCSTNLLMITYRYTTNDDDEQTATNCDEHPILAMTNERPPQPNDSATRMRSVKRRNGCAECTEDGRIGATEYAGWNRRGKGAEVLNKVRKKGRCGTYNVGVKDLASAYVLCPRLAECGGLSIYGRDRVLRNNEGIVSRVVVM